jgi:phytanoyl-CoA hydroxylase
MSTITQEIVNAEQRRSFEEQGFFVTDVLFDEATLADVRREFERLWQDSIATADAGDDIEQQQHARYRPFITQVHQNSVICNDFCRHPVFLQLCRELIGSDADLIWNQAIIKPPASTNNAFAWHQDQWYARHGDYAKDSNPELLQDPDNSFTAWVAISRTIVDNGTLWVLPGRHKEGLLPHVWSEERREWVGEFDTSWKIPAVLRPGQALIFNKYLPHGSSANISQETRMAYQIGYHVPGLKLAPSPDIVPVLRGGQAA